MTNKNQIILAFDQCTSATKVLLFNASANLVNGLSLPHEQYYPSEGFVEHDAEKIFENVKTGIQKLIADSKINKSKIAGIAITNHCKTALIRDKNTVVHVANNAVWQCQRGNIYTKKFRFVAAVTDDSEPRFNYSQRIILTVKL